MLSIYPTNFASLNGENCFDEYGELTSIGQVWLHEVEKLHMSQISMGMDNLRFKPNAQFAPSAVEFSAFCIEFGASECANEILEYIQESSESNWWWRTEAAFNVFIALGYSPARNQTDPQIVKDIGRIYRQLDFDNLKPIPVKSISIPVKEPSKIERDRGKFQGLMYFCINRLRPDLFLSAPTKDITSKQALEKFSETKRPLIDLVDFVAEQRGMVKDEQTLNLFTIHKSNELMIKWYKQKQPAMTDFLRNEGIAI